MVEKIGKYRILATLGHGGMGVVYKALDPLIERVVALKTISANLHEQPELRARFFREGKSAGQLSHKNIITIYDLGEDDGVAYMAMEFLEGIDLKKRIQNAPPMTIEQKLEIMHQVCAGLDHAHSKNVIHRDIKPANIFITNSGVVKILDFGLARIINSELTQTGLAMGTPNYMSPEQVRGENIDHRSDIFSTGILFYEMISHRKPFQGDSFASIAFKILQDEPEPLANYDSSIPASISEIIFKALAKDPQARYQTVNEMEADLGQYQRSTGDLTLAPVQGTAIPAKYGYQGGRSIPSAPRQKADSQIAVEPLSSGPSKAAGLGATRSTASAQVARPEAEKTASYPPGELYSDARSNIGHPGRVHGFAARRRIWLSALAVALIAIGATSWFMFQRRSQPTVRASEVIRRDLKDRPAAELDNRPSNTPTLVPPVENQKIPAGLARAGKALERGSFSEAEKEADAVMGLEPGNVQANEIRRRARESADLIGRGISKARNLMTAGKSQEAAAAVNEVLKVSPSDSEAGRLAAQLNQYARKGAEEALVRVRAARAEAEKFQASELAPKSFESAKNAEQEAIQLYQSGQYGQATVKLLEATGLYKGAEAEAGAQTNARAEKIRREDYEKQRIILQTRLDSARQSYESEKTRASAAGAESRASDRYHEALRISAEAESKAEKGDLEAAQRTFENATAAMQNARTIAAELARPEASHTPTETPKSAVEISKPSATPQQLISELLERYKAAMGNKDISLLKSLWPSLDETQEKAIRNEFRMARTLQVDFQIMEIRVEGDSATVVGKRRSQLKTLDGTNLRGESQTTVKLRKSSGNWVIESMRFE